MTKRMSLLVVAAVVALAAAGCATATSTGSPTPGRTITLAPSPTITAPAPASSGSTPPATSTTLPAPTVPAGRTAIAGRTVTTRCPVVTENGCPAVPVRARVELIDQAGRMMSTVDTDAQGGFVFTVTPGVYTVKASSLSGAFPRPASVDVTVRAGQAARITIMMDSGIR
jgi:hypothetical protein